MIAIKLGWYIIVIFVYLLQLVLTALWIWVLQFVKKWKLKMMEMINNILLVDI